MRLWRAHGLGNDYLVWEGGSPLTPEGVVAICDRHRGAGSDGILEPVPASGADYGVRIWNPDGSIAEKSGNGLRIFGRWLADRGAPGSFTVDTGFDRVVIDVGEEELRVAMGRAVADASVLPVLPGPPFVCDGETLQPRFISMGNPHAVLFVDVDPETLPWRAWGAYLERHPRIPKRTNVQIARVLAPNRVQLRVWERGAGETAASGSSASAVCAAAVFEGRVPPGVITAEMPGGTLTITVSAALDVAMAGPVERVGTITLDPRWAAARGLT